MYHNRNLHKNGYSFPDLIGSSPGLEAFVIENPKGEQTINFADSTAVKALNQALIIHHYGLTHWDIPEGYLCPAVPGRAEYVHMLADLLTNSNQLPEGNAIKLLDIGTGANLIYPILAHQIYGWSVVGTDIDRTAVRVGRALIEMNKVLQKGIQIRQQKTPEHIFTGIIRENDFFHISMCNPPFYANADEADRATQRKKKNLDYAGDARNFGGQTNELFTEGGEVAFLRQMIEESEIYQQQIGWFTCLISQKDHVAFAKAELKNRKALDVQVFPIHLGNKRSRFIAWHY